MDLGRFLRGEPVAARPIGVAERLRKWVRRRPAVAGLLAAAVLLAAAGLWLIQQRAQRRAELRNEVGTALAQAERLRKGFHFHEARELLEQARQQVNVAGPADLREPVNQAWDNLLLVENLDAARLRASSLVAGRFDPAGAEPLYEKTFAQAGLGEPGDDSEAVAARVRNSPVHAEIVGGLDNWASITQDQTRRAWLLAVARAADPDPSRDRLRQPELWRDGVGLTRLVQELPVDDLSPQLATALARRMRKTGGAVPLLSAAQSRFPQDFWLAFELGFALFVEQRQDEALGYYRAALALRPNGAEVHANLGMVLQEQERLDEAIRHFRQALLLQPKLARAHCWLGEALRDKGELHEAIDHFQEAIRLDPKGAAHAHGEFGRTMHRMGRSDEAIGHYEEALRLDPKTAGPTAHFNIGAILHGRGRLDEAIGHFQEVIRLDPKGSASAHLQLGLALRTKGRFNEALAEYRRTVELDPLESVGHENLADALLGMGRFAKARTAIRRGLDVLRAKDAHRPALWKKLNLCERLLARDGGLPALLQDKERLPPGDLLELARLCRNYGRPHAATDLYAAAFAARPALADDLEAADRYYAACAAVRAAAGEGPHGARLSPSEGAELRRQALAWLRADLALRTRLHQDGNSVGSALAIWQTDSALSGVREEAALAKLPQGECASWQRLWADVAALRAADHVDQGRARAARGDWSAAADCYARALARRPTEDGHFWFEYAAVLLLSGDRSGYATACAHLVERCGKEPGPRAYHVARAYTLAPNAVAEPSLPGRLAEKELQQFGREFWSLTERGALAYRASRYQKAVSFFEKSLEADSKPGRAVVNWLWLALAQQRLGKAKEARRWLNKATAWLDQYRDGMPDRAEEDQGLHLHNWLEAQVLRREAEALIRPAEKR
jgi:tetratricopeptide (TPR) repeat protein